jgi:hypothetical protein
MAKGLVTCKRKVLRRMTGGIRANKHWRWGYNKELMQPFGVLDILSFVRVSQLNWIGHVNRMDSKRTGKSQIFNNNPQQSRLTAQPKKQKVELCTNRYAKLRIGKTGQKGELTGRSPLRRRRSALGCSAI